MAQLITHIQHQLSTLPPHHPLPKPLTQSFIQLIQSILPATTLTPTPTPTPTLRTQLLLLVISLDQRNLQLPVNLAIQLIQHYAQLNKSIIHDIIQHNLDHNPQLIQHFKSSIQQLVQELILNPDQYQLASTLSLITQSHPQLLELFYQSSSDHAPNSPLLSIIKIIENDRSEEPLSGYIRTQLIFIILKVLKDGVIPRLQRATAAFDSSDLVHQLCTILSSKSRPFVTDLKLNYSDLIDQIDDLIHHSSGSSTLSTKCKNQLDVFFQNSNDFLIFQIYRSNNEHYYYSSLQYQNRPQSGSSVDQNQILNVIKSRKNIFDDHMMDVSLLSKGKSKLDEKTILNDKSHLTDSMKEKMKLRLEAIEMNQDELEDSTEIPIIFDDNDDDDDDDNRLKELNEDDERSRKLGKMVQIDIFSDDDDLFLPNKNHQMDDESEEEGESDSRTEEENEVQVSKKETIRPMNNSFTKNKQTNRENKHKGKPFINDRSKQTQGEDNQARMSVPTRSIMRGTGMKSARGDGGGARGKSRVDVRGRGSGRGRGRGGGNQGQPFNRTKENPNQQSSSSQLGDKPANDNVQDNNETNQTSSSSTSHHTNKPPPSFPTRGSRIDHQKKSHDRRVRGRDRKLAQISGGI